MGSRPSGERSKRVIGRIYSAAADGLYEPLVVKGAFRVFGGRLNAMVVEQGRRAVTSAGGRPILDMPVGTGYFTLEMAGAHTGIVVGVDIAEGMVRQTAARARQMGAGNLVAVQADAHGLPFEDGAFGAVVCSNGLQVMPGLVPTVTELARVLAPGGSLFVSVILAAAGALLPRDFRRHLPTLLRPSRDIATVLSDVGLTDVQLRRERMAALLEATKP
ncbi:MAG: class I SAM-dependent methyltransferase [Actinomycetota bacterium]|nr:class I SAM-dependent methyltransferase [Actinomycetota bacterium]